MSNVMPRYAVCVVALVAAVALSGGSQAADTRPAIIPQPMEVQAREGAFTITPRTAVVAVGPAAAEAKKLVEALAPATGFRLAVATSAPSDGAVALSLDGAIKATLGEEGYTLEVTPARIDLKAAGPAGLFYGIQTLRQLLPPDIYRNAPVEGVAWRVPCVLITDRPRFGWRGLLIDPARHFIPVADVKTFIDAMALNKFNHLQIHLTDDQGWRIEIRKYPRLTEVGSKRDYSGGRGGFYTQDQVRDLVRYARRRHVTIVPEIEMPGHTGAARDAYPEVLAPSLQDHGRVLVPRPKAVAFMQDVLAEVMDLFPSPCIHIGGDEASTGQWAASDEMKAQMRRLNLKDIHELHSWFIRQMDAYLARHGRRLVGWDEILQGGLAEGATVMSWRGTAGGIAAARAGHDVVMAPTSHTYFDYRQARGEKGFGGSVLPLEKVYTFEPAPSELDAAQARHILGGQGQLWGEKIPDKARREYMTYPRACALIETLWSPKESRDFRAFRERLAHHLRRLEAAGIRYRPLEPLPADGNGEAASGDGGRTVTVANGILRGAEDYDCENGKASFRASS
ncbi:MAG: beta-N-acetylhexosaminidase [Phycisphaerae bacterium]